MHDLSLLLDPHASVSQLAVHPLHTQIHACHMFFASRTIACHCVQI